MIGTYRYTGRDRRCTAQGGTTSSDPAAFIEKRYRRGWRAMTMTAEDGREVGAICLDTMTGQRMWWAEPADGE